MHVIQHVRGDFAFLDSFFRYEASKFKFREKVGEKPIKVTGKIVKNNWSKKLEIASDMLDYIHLSMFLPIFRAIGWGDF